MEISNARHQAMAGHGLQGVVACPRTQQQQERKLRPHPEHALKCPRCASTNTKFCYYNNYSLSQPRYFCKGCRRYWTQGGSVRNVPVGGGCRKNKRSSSSSSSSSKKAQDQDLTTTSTTHPTPVLLPTLMPPPVAYDPSDLTLTFAAGLPKQSPIKHFGLDDKNHNFFLGNTNTNPMACTPAPANGFLDILRTGFVDMTGTPPSGFDNIFYGLGANGCSSLEMPTGVSGEEGGLSGATASTTTSHGSCKAMDGGDNNKVLMTGLPWHDGNMDPGRDCWINGVGSSWQGLINSSLL